MLIVWINCVMLIRKIEKEGEQLREMMEEEGKIDRHKKLQGGMPDIDKTLVNFHIEQL